MNDIIASKQDMIEIIETAISTHDEALYHKWMEVMAMTDDYEYERLNWLWSISQRLSH